MANDFAADIDAIQRIDAVPRILEVVCRSTGMGFAAVAGVTGDRWVCCAVRDEIEFGLQPGGELKVETTICHEIRQSHQAVVIEHVAQDEVFSDHHTPATKLYFDAHHPGGRLNVRNPMRNRSAPGASEEYRDHRDVQTVR